MSEAINTKSEGTDDWTMKPARGEEKIQPFFVFCFFLSFLSRWRWERQQRKSNFLFNMQKGFDSTSNSNFQSQQSHTNCNGIKTQMERKHPHYIPIITVRRIKAHKCYSVPYSIESVELGIEGMWSVLLHLQTPVQWYCSLYVVDVPQQKCACFCNKKTKERTNLDVQFFFILFSQDWLKDKESWRFLLVKRSSRWCTLTSL